MRYKAALLFSPLVAVGLLASPAAPQTAATPKPAPAVAPAPAAPAAQTPPNVGWASRCASAGRKVDLECSVEQTAVLKTGQVVVQFRVVIPSGPKAPVMVVQLPLGILLPPGLRLKVDDGKTFGFSVQACEQRGCLVTAPLPAELLALMKSGKTLTVSFTTVANETADIPLQLSQFADAYAKIE